MHLVPQIRIDQWESRTLQTAFRPWRLLADQGEIFAKQARMLESTHLFNEHQVLSLKESFRRLAPLLEGESRAEADPRWIVQNQKTLDEGMVPLVLNPQGAMAVIRETRLCQLSSLKEGLALLDRMIEMLASVLKSGTDEDQDFLEEEASA